MILTFSDNYEIAYEMLTKVREIAGSIAIASIVIGKPENAEDYIAHGADKVFLVDIAPHADHVVHCLSALIDQHKPDILLIGGTRLGKAAAPRIAQRYGVGCATDCIDLSIKDEQLNIQRFVLGGRFIATQKFLRKPQIATVMPRRFEKKSDTTRKGEVIEFACGPAETRIGVLESIEKAIQEVRIEEAEIIVSAGRGLKKKEDLKMIHDLAEALGGAMGCTRSIAADLQWLPEQHWIGLSGHKVKPKLYIAIGISGQVQHIAGIRDAKTIIAINKDPNAPIFKACDYGIVGDLYEIVPALTGILSKQV